MGESRNFAGSVCSTPGFLRINRYVVVELWHNDDPPSLYFKMNLIR
jgi:hypothetical protein